MMQHDIVYKSYIKLKLININSLNVFHTDNAEILFTSLYILRDRETIHKTFYL